MLKMLFAFLVLSMLLASCIDERDTISGKVVGQEIKPTHTETLRTCETIDGIETCKTETFTYHETYFLIILDRATNREIAVEVSGFTFTTYGIGDYYAVAK
jgi:predicted small secreted protein